jgi:hypothetical protein
MVAVERREHEEAHVEIVLVDWKISTCSSGLAKALGEVQEGERILPFFFANGSPRGPRYRGPRWLNALLCCDFLPRSSLLGERFYSDGAFLWPLLFCRWTRNERALGFC